MYITFKYLINRKNNVSLIILSKIKHISYFNVEYSLYSITIFSFIETNKKQIELSPRIVYYQLQCFQIQYIHQ